MRLQLRRQQRRLAGFERLLNFVFRFVDHLAELGSLLSRQLTQLLEALRQDAFLAQILYPDLIQPGQIVRLRQRQLGRVNQIH